MVKNNEILISNEQGSNTMVMERMMIEAWQLRIAEFSNLQHRSDTEAYFQIVVGTDKKLYYDVGQ